jgi:hypothetical protein
MVFVTLVVAGTITALLPGSAGVFAPILAFLSAVTPPVPAPVAAAVPPLARLGPAIAAARQPCRIVQGFALLESYVGPSVVGTCLADEQFDPATATSAQPTTGGLLVWRKADGALGFTDGHRTWLVGPAGLQQRLNTQRYCWEFDADPRRCTTSALKP